MRVRDLITLLFVSLGTASVADPHWSADDINASRVVHEAEAVNDPPEWSADPAGLLLLDGGDPLSVTLLDGGTFDVLGRIETDFAPQGRPIIGPDGRYLYRLSSDGWVQKIDLWTLGEVARVRAGLISHDMALSHDGKWLAVGNDTPNTLTLLIAADLSVAEVHLIVDKHDTPSGVTSVATRPTQESFILTLGDVHEIHEVFYGPNPPFYGFVHDYRIEGPPDETEAFPMRYITVPERLGDFRFDPSFEYVMAAVQGGTGAVIVDLVIGHKVAAPEMPGRPDWGSTVTWQQGDQGAIAVPHLTSNGLSLINLSTWETLGQIATATPVGAVQSHASLPTIWALVGGRVQVIDKHSLTTLKTLKPLPGATPGGMTITGDGAHALITFPDEDAVIVLNTTSFAEVTRLDLSKPVLIHSIGQ